MNKHAFLASIAIVAMAAVGLAEPPAHAANGSAVTGSVVGNTRSPGDCNVPPPFIGLKQIVVGDITTSNTRVAHIEAHACYEIGCPEGGCFVNEVSGTFTITKGAAAISGAIVDGDIGPTATKGSYGFRLDLRVNRGSKSLASPGTPLKFTGFWKARHIDDPGKVKGNVSLRPVPAPLS